MKGVFASSLKTERSLLLISSWVVMESAPWVSILRFYFLAEYQIR